MSSNYDDIQRHLCNRHCFGRLAKKTSSRVFFILTMHDNNSCQRPNSSQNFSANLWIHSSVGSTFTIHFPIPLFSMNLKVIHHSAMFHQEHRQGSYVYCGHNKCYFLSSEANIQNTRNFFLEIEKIVKIIYIVAKGSSINDVRRCLTIFDPPSPLKSDIINGRSLI